MHSWSGGRLAWMPAVRSAFLALRCTSGAGPSEKGPKGLEDPCLSHMSLNESTC